MDPFLLDSVPVWVIFVALLAVFLSATWAGYQLGQWRRSSSEESADSEADMSGVVSASLFTLTGFLLAFSFSSAGSHFDQRRQAVIDDANAVGGTFAGTDLLQEPYRSNLRSLLIEYADLRTAIDQFEGNEDRLDEFRMRSEDLQEKMLVEGTAAARLDPTPVVATFVNSLNTLIDVDNIRTDLRWNRIPLPVFLFLGLLSVLAMVLVGYVRGLRGRPAVLSVFVLAFAYAVVFAMVIDLDRHTNGIFSVNQQPMIEVSESLQGL